ncbi:MULTISPECIES: hypothetical protein [unclassified Rhodococcus (in: high G+C Gram-positive bacteria)]|uniref:hypothetical protein n=1 Tax=unclassified Rhodococcus (in: high G+C Gram-positive bacteria) TaxID=192944 RepID=UPI00114288CE|nr:MULTISPECIES: hypothetical protein [unclassified Rhodococcus (in: high G+C Gram-positive bacteria)]TQC36020.1 hypothetical protein EEB16_20905 [Rhodococcus sp. WS7]
MTEATALLLSMRTPDGISDAEFDAWIHDEHFPERIRISGFQTTLRYENKTGTPQSLCLYDVDDISVLRGPEYAAVSGANLSPWSRRMNAVSSAHWRFTGIRSPESPDEPIAGSHENVVQILMVRWQGVSERRDRAHAAVVQSAVEDVPGVDRIRLFVGENGVGFDYVAVVESSIALPVDVTSAGRFDTDSDKCDFAQTFVPVASPNS